MNERKINPDVERLLFTREQIDSMVKDIGERVTKAYEGTDLLVVGVLTGAFIFVADLIRELDLPLEVDFVGASSYRDGAVSGKLVMTKEHKIDPKGRDVLIVDDLIDTGKTLHLLKKYYEDLGAKSVKICVLLNKKEARKVELEPDFFGDYIENEFVIGNGLEYSDRYRGLPYIGVLKREIYE